MVMSFKVHWVITRQLKLSPSQGVPATLRLGGKHDEEKGNSKT